MDIALRKRYQELHKLIKNMKRVDGNGSSTVNVAVTKRYAPKVLSLLREMKTDDMPKKLQGEVAQTIDILSNSRSSEDLIASQCFRLLSMFG